MTDWQRHFDILADSNQLDFRNPEAFYHDVNSVAGLLKQFFRDLPDPLLTREHYQGFIEAARKQFQLTCRGSHFILYSDKMSDGRYR